MDEERPTMKNQLMSLTVGMLTLALLSIGSVAGATDSPELVVNGGFEATDVMNVPGSPITGWTQSGNITGGWGGAALDNSGAPYKIGRAHV